MELITKQYPLTVAAGKRLIAKAILQLEQVQKALTAHTVVIVSGSTNGYVAEELLTSIGQLDNFSKSSFLRGVNVAPGAKVDTGEFSGADIVIQKGVWQRGKTIFDVAEGLQSDDVIIKGANALDADRKEAAIQIGNPTFGTSAPMMQAVMGRRVQLVIPVGLEKRVFGSIAHLSALLASPGASGPRLLPVTGTIVTELEAVELLLGVSAELVAAGGVLGAEGGCWLAVTGTQQEMKAASEFMLSVMREPRF